VNKKSLLIAFLAATMIVGLTSVGTMHFGMAQSGIISIMDIDTTWTKANSPYSLNGPLVIGNGVTLTVEAGATVNFNNYYIVVNGTLHARGSSADQIHFNGGNITFTGYSNAWNEQTGSGCIIENAVLSSTSIFNGNSLKIADCAITAGVSVGGSSIVSSNTITGDVSAAGSTLISNNLITGKVSAGDSSVV